MTSTPRNLVNRSLRLLGVTSPGQPVDPDDFETAWQSLREFLDDLGTQRLSIYHVVRTAFNLVSGTASYTIGTGGVFNVDRPLWIERVGLIRDPATTPVAELPLGKPLSDLEYSLVRHKAATGEPRTVYYDHGHTAGLGTIYPLPVPDSSTPDLVLYLPTPLATFADTAAAKSTAYEFPRGYLPMLIANLAVVMAPYFQKEASATIRAEAMRTMLNIKRGNYRLNTATLDAALPGLRGRRRYDIDADA